MASQVEIHVMANSEDVDERIRAAELLSETFGRLEDKDLAWKDLHKLTQDEDCVVR